MLMTWVLCHKQNCQIIFDTENKIAPLFGNGIAKKVVIPNKNICQISNSKMKLHLEEAIMLFELISWIAE